MKAIHAVVLTSADFIADQLAAGYNCHQRPEAAKVVDASGNLRVPGD